MFRPVILSVLCLIGTAAAAEAFMAGNPKAGAGLADAHCRACHAIGETAATEAAVEAPNFAALAAAPDRYPLKDLRKSLATPHWSADAPALSSKDADNLIAYILSLRPDK